MYGEHLPFVIMSLRRISSSVHFDGGEAAPPHTSILYGSGSCLSTYEVPSTADSRPKEGDDR